jgi:hypothetical protein
MLAVAAASLSACSSLMPPPPPVAAASAPAATASATVTPGAAAAKPDASAPKPFADVIKDAQVQDGYLPIWRKDDKVWLEVPAERLGQPLLMTANIAQSVGERGLYASQMGPDWMIEFRRVGNNLQLIALNTDYRPGTDAASKQAVSQAFSESLIASAAVASAPHPERKSVLIDASFLLADIAGYATRLEAAFRLSYALDKGNSSFSASRADASLSTLTAKLHFSTAKLPAPPLTPSPTPTPPPPKTVPDARSFFVSVVYSFAKLADTPMAPRPADPRLGHFTEDYTDFSGDFKANQRVHLVKRWRLDKKDPDAALSEPVQPITYWLDRNIPERYRASVAAGVLEWNKAFERLGYRNAVVVQQQADDADFDTLDASHASIRWFVGADVGFAIGPSKSDPRSGEILDADIGMSDVFGRGARRMLVEDVGARVSSGLRAGHDAHCDYAHEAATEMGFALDLLESRGDIAPDSPEADAFVQSVIKDVIMHEVGHTLGLKHNFKASTTVSQAQLRDPAFTQSRGISGSVMDYNAYNLPLKGEAKTAVSNTTLGAYDYWAIEYAYRPLAVHNQAAELKRIAARSTEPALAYADDADAEGGPTGNLDPMANRFDLGDDPLAYYRKRLKLSQELWQRVQDRPAQAGDDPLRARRVLGSGFRQLRNLPELAAKYVGGMNTLRDLPGTTGRAAYRPVPPARQREALRLLSDGVFGSSAFEFRPEFLTTLSPDYSEWERDKPVNVGELVLKLQTPALDRLMSGGTAQRLLELPNYLSPAERRGALSLDEVYSTLQQSIWSELGRGSEINALRRSLQREHLKRVQAVLLKGGVGMPADGVSLVRWQATRLQAELKRAVAKGGLSVETRAHLAESLAGLTEALRASMTRS